MKNKRQTRDHSIPLATINMTSTEETAKKRKRDGQAAGVEESGDGGGVAGMEKILAGMKAQMAMMQNELDDTRGRFESKTASMQNEMDEMKIRLLHTDELERKCKYLEVRCESLERSVQMLRKDTNWEYSAPAIPTSHWIDRGFDENYIENMEDFLEKVQTSGRYLFVCI